MEFLSREECLELKEAGFPQDTTGLQHALYYDLAKEAEYSFHLRRGDDWRPDRFLRCPTLDEILTDLGRRFWGIEYNGANPEETPYEASGFEDLERRGNVHYLAAATPLQSARALWLAVRGAQGRDGGAHAQEIINSADLQEGN